MGLFDLFKKKPQKETFFTCSNCNRKTTISPDNTITESYICPECREIRILQNCNAKIIDIDRRASGPERTLTVLFYDETIGYFCVRQSSGAYSGLGLWYYILPKDISNPKIEDYIENYEVFTCVPNIWFSDAFSDDIHGKRCMHSGEITNN